MKPLSRKQLELSPRLYSKDFINTEELESLHDVLGQERALKALDFAIGVNHQGYNLYVMGPPGLSKHAIIKDVLSKIAAERPAPSDWCYTHNFEQDNRPKILELPAGRGRKFSKNMDALITELGKSIPAAFETNEYRERIQLIERDASTKQTELIKKYKKIAREDSILLEETPSGFTLSPIVNEKALSLEEFNLLAQDTQDQFNEKTNKLQEELEFIIPQLNQISRDSNDKIKSMNRDVALYATGHLIKDLIGRYGDINSVVLYLESIQKDVLDHLQDFTEYEDEIPGAESNPVKNNSLERYKLNLLVDNSKLTGAPVIYLDNPTYHNLVGRIEYDSYMGSIRTDFTLIKSGAIHQANGGYLIIDAEKLLVQPFAWDALKRALYSHMIRIESMEQMLSTDSTKSLDPDPIPIDLKIILIGDRQLYYELHQIDPDFSELFKVEADFDEEVIHTAENNYLYARLLATRCRKLNLREIEKQAVSYILLYSSRLAGDSEKLSTKLRSITELLIEADYWANKSSHQYITLDDVVAAIRAQTLRLSRIQTLIQEDINSGTILINTDGKQTGQVNGLSVFDIGKYGFGQPSCITATVRLGNGHIINIEREVDLSGSIHDKGVLILSALLASRYGKNLPLSFSASIAFEQSYGRIDGDSASVAEYCALISALIDLPINQGYAVTGSLNQQGKVQAIGGVNEKIEGFFEVCKSRGLTGEQGCIIPAINRKNLLLNDEVLNAIEEGNFHIYVIENIDEALEILTGRETGKLMPDGEYEAESINDLVNKQLIAMAERSSSFNQLTLTSDTKSS
ncbi:MAG: AAA family ATPase [Gammaproteobacteria bacterium]|nr:AAA family ATPase [Gammaproteobacteria bacterium]